MRAASDAFNPGGRGGRSVRQAKPQEAAARRTGKDRRMTASTALTALLFAASAGPPPVLDVAAGEGVLSGVAEPGAEVRVVRGGVARRVRCDAAGRFRVEGLSAGLVGLHCGAVRRVVRVWPRAAPPTAVAAVSLRSPETVRGQHPAACNGGCPPCGDGGGCRGCRGGRRGHFPLGTEAGWAVVAGIAAVATIEAVDDDDAPPPMEDGGMAEVVTP